MTQARLEALQKLSAYISYTEDALTELKCAQGLCICGYDTPDGVANKYLIDTLEEDDYLRAIIVKHYEDKLARLRKEFEEA